MFRILRATLLGLVIFVVVFWGIIPFMLGYDYSQKHLSELQERIEAEKLLATNGRDPNKVTETSKNIIKTELEPVSEDLVNSPIKFTEESYALIHVNQLERFLDKYLIATNPPNDAIWLSSNKYNYYNLQLWQPKKGTLRNINIAQDSLGFSPNRKPVVSASSSGLLLTGGEQLHFEPKRMVFIDPAGYLATAELNVLRDKPLVHALNDGSFIIIGGKTPQFDKSGNIVFSRRKILYTGYSPAVELVQYKDNKLSVTRLPDLPGEPRRGMGIVQLADGRIMILGGSSSKYVGSQPITSETYILNIDTKIWEVGPPMLSPRTAPTVTTLRDNSVLVAGGWTAEENYQKGPSASIERWKLGENKFSSYGELPVKQAYAKPVWYRTDKNEDLLLVGGSAGDAVIAYSENTWKTVGYACKSDSRTYEIQAVPLEINGQLHLWCFEPNTVLARAYNTVALNIGNGNNFSQLSESNNGIRWNRTRTAYITPTTTSAGLIVGGNILGSVTAAVDAVLHGGKIYALPQLKYKRENAQVFRLSDTQWLVVGGTSGGKSKRSIKYPPPELLTMDNGVDSARWREVNLEFKPGVILGQLKGQSFLALNPDGSVEKLQLNRKEDGTLYMQSEAFPSIYRARRINYDAPNSARITIKQLDDGRIIIAGGEVQQHLIAVLNDQSHNSDVKDEFISEGYFYNANYYDIYDPKTHSWNESTSSETEGRFYSILKNGQVLFWGDKVKNYSKYSNTDSEHELGTSIKISNSTGTHWEKVNFSDTDININLLSTGVNLFSMYDEIFLAAYLKDMRGMIILKWFNQETKKWHNLWSGERKNNHSGQLIMRKLKNDKQVVIPLELH